jgi:hypothetical protein
MRHRLILPLVLLIVWLLAPAAADASRYRVGIGDQSASMFSHSAFQRLHLKRVRYLVPWDWERQAFQRGEIAAYLNAASGKEVLVTFTASRGCWNGRYSKARHCRAPSAARYRRSFKRFRAAFPSVHVFAPWNEANHASQPTSRSPKRAASYYNVVRKACRRCTIVAADVLDQSGVERYLKRFRRYAKGSPRLWGLHNYSDVNRRRTKGTRGVLRTVPGKVWLTETGGLVSFLPNFRYSTSRAAARTKYMFKLADRYSKRRRGLRSRVTRIYPYAWTGVGRSARFDAGFTNPDGSLRKAYSVFRAKVRTRSK